MRLLSRLLLVILLLIGDGAGASQTVPSSFFGMNWQVDPTVAGNQYPNYSTIARTYQSNYNSAGHATFWSTLEASSGVFSWTGLSAILAQLNTFGLFSEVTLGYPATWVVNPVTNFVMSGTPTSGQMQTYLSFTQAFANQYASLAYPTYVSGPNEWNRASPYSGVIPWGQLSTVSLAMYPMLSPRFTVFAPPIAPVNGPNGSNLPESGWYPYEQYLIGCAGQANKCFDDRNLHFYPESPVMTNPANLVQYAPELILNGLNQESAIANAQGFGSYPLVADEGFCGNPSNNGPSYLSSDSDQWAGDQFKCLMLMSAFASPQVKTGFWYSWGTNVAGGNEYGGSLLGAVNGLNATGRAFRTAVNLLTGATWTGSAVNNSYISRTAATNQVRSQGDGAGAALGIVYGTGANCSPVPSGSGALPSTWNYGGGSVPGLTMAVAAINTTTHAITIRQCGQITTNGAGAAIGTIYFDSAGAAASLGQNWHLGYCETLVAGSTANVQYFEPNIQELASGSGVANTYDPFLYPALNQRLCYSFRTVLSGAGVTAARPSELTAFWYSGNGSAGTLPVDITRTFDTITEDQGVVWSGSFTRPNGCNYTVAWTEDGSSQAFSTALAYWIDKFGASGPVNGGSYALGGDPIVFSSCKPNAGF